jgi:hypothetical protein
VNRREKTLDAPSASGLTRPREHELHLEVGRDLLKVFRGEVLSMIGVEGARDAADVPAWVALAPDRLAESQRGTEDTGRIEPDSETSHRTAVVVDDHGEPGTSRLFLGVEDPDIERRVVGLPDLVRAVGLPSIEEVVLLAVRLRPCLRQGDERRIECADDRVDAGVARNGPVMFLGDGGSLAVDHSRAQGWPT